MHSNSRGFHYSKTSDLTKTMYCNKMADVMYHINGTGRDTYIFNNNGGFAAMHQPGNKGVPPGSFLPKVKGSPIKYPNVVAQAMPKRYLTDGTGRDIYIYTNDGGQTIAGGQAMRDPIAIFQRSLRGYERDGDYLRRHQRPQRRSNFQQIGLRHDLNETEDSSIF